MEGLAAAATIIQVADFGLRVVHEIYSYLDSYNSADRRLERVAKSVKLTADLIHDIASLFRNKRAERLMRSKAKSTAEETAKECEDVFTELLEIVTKTKKKKWTFPFKVEQIQLISAHLESLKSTLNCLLGVLTNVQLMREDPGDEGWDEVKRLKREMEMSEVRYRELKQSFDRLVGSLAPGPSSTDTLDKGNLDAGPVSPNFPALPGPSESAGEDPWTLSDDHTKHGTEMSKTDIVECMFAIRRVLFRLETVKEALDRSSASLTTQSEGRTVMDEYNKMRHRVEPMLKKYAARPAPVSRDRTHTALYERDYDRRALVVREGAARRFRASSPPREPELAFIRRRSTGSLRQGPFDDVKELLHEWTTLF